MLDSGDMMTTVTIGGDSLPLQAACDQAVMALNELGVRADEMNAQSEGMGLSMSGFTAELGAALGPLGDLAGGIGQAAEQALGFVAAIAGWQIIQQVISWVQQLSDALFDLQVQTQRNSYAWQYLFSGPSGPSGQNASDLMNWSSQFSMGIPFTRQDLMQAITFAGSAQLNTAQAEQFMPFLADIASTYGSARGTTLSTAMQAVWMAMMGRSYMLKMDLGVSPEELIPYGLQATGSGMGLHITDPNSVITSLEKWAVAKHISNWGANNQDVNGAAGGTVANTWWGGWSSLVDNMQNFLLQVGGTNLNGSIEPGSFFGTLQNALDGLLNWFTQHKDEIKSFADTLSHLMGDTVTIGGGWIGALIEDLNKLGAVQSIQSGLTDLDKTLESWFGLDNGKATAVKGEKRRNGMAMIFQQDSEMPTWLSQLVQAFQTIAGLSWQGAEAFVGMLIQNGPSITQTLSSMASSLQTIATSLTPEEQKILVDFMGLLGGTVGVSARETLYYMAQAANTLHFDLALLNPMLEADGLFFQQLGQNLQRVAPLLQQIGQFAQGALQPFQLLAAALQQTNEQLHDLATMKLPSWLTNAAGGLAGVGGNLTNMPGLFRQFGVVGAK